jgi:hypothetical protein
MKRSIAAVLIGYAIFGVSAGLLFGVSGVDPHATPTVAFAALAIAYGLVLATLAGVVAATIARRRRARHAAIVSAIVASAAILSLATKRAGGSGWSELATLGLFAPTIWVAGAIVAHMKDQARR